MLHSKSIADTCIHTWKVSPILLVAIAIYCNINNLALARMELSANMWNCRVGDPVVGVSVVILVIWDIGNTTVRWLCNVCSSFTAEFIVNPVFCLVVHMETDHDRQVVTRLLTQHPTLTLTSTNNGKQVSQQPNTFYMGVIFFCICRIYLFYGLLLYFQ